MMSSWATSFAHVMIDRSPVYLVGLGTVLAPVVLAAAAYELLAPAVSVLGTSVVATAAVVLVASSFLLLLLVRLWSLARGQIDALREVSTALNGMMRESAHVSRDAVTEGYQQLAALSEATAALDRMMRNLDESAYISRHVVTEGYEQIAGLVLKNSSEPNLELLSNQISNLAQRMHSIQHTLNDMTASVSDLRIQVQKATDTHEERIEGRMNEAIRSSAASVLGLAPHFRKLEQDLDIYERLLHATESQQQLSPRGLQALNSLSDSIRETLRAVANVSRG